MYQNQDQIDANNDSAQVNNAGQDNVGMEALQAHAQPGSGMDE